MSDAREPKRRKRILLIANTARFLVLFEANDMRILTEMGYEIHCASNFREEQDETDAQAILNERGAVTHQIDIARSPLAPGNLRAYRQLLSLMDKYAFDAVHCHTPMGAALARMAAHKKHIAPVLYTVHGLHFYKGAPLANWLLYCPVETFLSRWTDTLITINREDYARAKRQMHARRTAYLPGIGIDSASFRGTDEEGANRAQALREEFGIPEDAVVILSVGDLNENKNHKTVIEALSLLKRPDVFYLICGHGPLAGTLEQLAVSLGLGGQVREAGYRKDVRDFYRLADIYAFPSRREGLSVAVMEAMASGLPCVVSRIRGNTDLIEDGKGGYLCGADDAEAFAEALRKLLDDKEKRAAMGEENLRAIRNFDISAVDRKMRKIYAETL